MYAVEGVTSRFHLGAFIACIPFVALTNVPLNRLVADAFVEETALNPLVAVKVQVVHTKVPVEEFKTPAATAEAVIVDPVIVMFPFKVLDTP